MPSCRLSTSAERTGPHPRAARDALVRSLTRFTRDRDLAEDCVQAAHLRLAEFRRTHAVHSENSFLARASRNIAIDEGRKAQVRRRFAPDLSRQWQADETGQPLQDDILLARERLHLAQAVLETLPERTRAVFLMHRLSQMKYREIAAAAGISVSAVEKHIARAAQALSTRMAEECEA